MVEKKLTAKQIVSRLRKAEVLLGQIHLKLTASMCQTPLVRRPESYKRARRSLLAEQ